MQGFSYVNYLAHALSTFLFAAHNVLLAATITYVYRTEYRTCTSARLDDMLAWKDGRISTYTMQLSCCTSQISYGAKTFGKNIKLRSSVSSTVFPLLLVSELLLTNIYGFSSKDIAILSKRVPYTHETGGVRVSAIISLYRLSFLFPHFM